MTEPEHACTLGDGPIDPEYYGLMQDVAHALDYAFNGAQRPRSTGFVLLVFPFGDDGRCNYISNARREDVVVMLKEQLAKLQGSPDATGHA